MTMMMMLYTLENHWFKGIQSLTYSYSKFSRLTRISEDLEKKIAKPDIPFREEVYQSYESCNWSFKLLKKLIIQL